MNFRTNSMLMLFAAAVTMTVPRPAQAQYTGDAYALKLNVPSLALITIGDTGPLPSSGGGPFTKNLANANVGSNVAGLGATTGVINDSTKGLGGVATSFAIVNNLNVTTTTPLSLLSATLVRSDASASSGGTVGSSTITGLVFNANSVTVTGAPNQTVLDAFGDTLIINQQILNGDGSLTVNALDLSLVGGTSSLVVSSATAGFGGGAANATPEPGGLALLTGVLVSGGLFAIRRGRKFAMKQRADITPPATKAE